MRETDIRDFWDQHPCGDGLVGGLGKFRGDYEQFFSEYDAYRYRKEGHILRRLDQVDWSGKQVLEIGLGQGADSEQLIRRGACWSGLDLTPESIERVGARLALRNLPHVALKRGSVLDIPFPDNSFDVVFSHGVLHHVPDIDGAQREIQRVLKPDGKLIVMLYAKYSLNYLLSIAVIRRLGLLLLYSLGRNPGGMYGEHLALARAQGIWRYLQLDNFIHRNTDGPGNPYSKVYDLPAVRRDFSRFEITYSSKDFMHAPPLPVGWLPMAHLLGWHLWAHLRPRPTGQ